MDREASHPEEGGVAIFTITQATSATFRDLYNRHTSFLFVERGEKRVQCPVEGELVGGEGDLIIFPPSSLITLENRPVSNAAYRAIGVSFPHRVVAEVFSDQPTTQGTRSQIQILKGVKHQPAHILTLVEDTLSNTELPASIREHRLMEPLVWARENGVSLPNPDDDQPYSKVRSLIETDLAHDWRAADVASHFAMSEATFRRWLSKSGHSYSKILNNTRLENGLAKLQVSDTPISEIALNCGFKTPSHFSDAFKQRFGIRPREIRTREALSESR